jgi:hypothetical protein
MFNALFLALATFIFQSQAFAQIGEITLEAVGRYASCEEAEDKGAYAFNMHTPSVQRTPLGITVAVSATVYQCLPTKNGGMSWKVSGSLPNQYLVAEYWRDVTLKARKGDMMSVRNKKSQRGEAEFALGEVFTNSENEVIVNGGSIEKRFDLFLGQVTMQNYYQVSAGKFWLTVEFLGNGETRVKSLSSAR